MNVTGFGGVFQVIDMSAQFSWPRCYFINARISKLESNCDEANRQHLLNNGRVPQLELLELIKTVKVQTNK